MKQYFPKFTLRRALIAIALLAVFLGWLRPDRLEARSGADGILVIVRPIYPKEIQLSRLHTNDGVDWMIVVRS